jgi:hypothetical protein
MSEIMPGDRVMVFDYRLFKDDKLTPLSHTVRPATVVCRYGIKEHGRTYEDLCDVLFDHRNEHVSHGHFTYGVKRICRS